MWKSIFYDLTFLMSLCRLSQKISGIKRMKWNSQFELHLEFCLIKFGITMSVKLLDIIIFCEIFSIFYVEGILFIVNVTVSSVDSYDSFLSLITWCSGIFEIFRGGIFKIFLFLRFFLKNPSKLNKKFSVERGGFVH